MTSNLPTEPLKKIALDWSRYRDTNPVPTSLLADDDLATVSLPLGLVAVSSGGLCIL